MDRNGCGFLPPGPELDAAIGKRVFGVERSARKYSTDVNEAAGILTTRAWNPRWVIRESGRFPGQWEVIEPLAEKVFVDNTSDEFRRIAVGRTPAHAICLAVLTAPATDDP